MKTASSARLMPSVAGTGCCRDHTCGTAPPWVVPNSCRAAATTALSGFHSATTRSQVGMFWVGTNTLEMNPSRNAGSMDSVSADCGLWAIMPSQMPTQAMAKPNSCSSRKPRTARPSPASARQPTTRAQTIVTNSAGSPMIVLLAERPMSTADRAIGRVRIRSMTPSLMSVATAVATVAEAKIAPWANSPDSR
jgi:hypothetical protein